MSSPTPRTAPTGDGAAPTDADERFRRYVEPELDVLLRVAHRLTRDPTSAEDLVQETLLRAYRAIERFDGRHPRAWLLTILRNTHINELRRRRPVLVDDADRTFSQLPAPGADGRTGAEEEVLERMLRPELADALRAMPAHQREILLLVDVEGLRYKEAAETLGIPTGTVMSRLHRARRQLRAGFERNLAHAGEGESPVPSAESASR